MSKLTIVNYHYIRDFKNSRFPNLKGCELAKFREHMKYLAENYTPVTMQQVADAIDKKAELPKNAAMVTFDDGYLEHFTVAYPILEYNKIKGNFYVCNQTIRIERPNHDMYSLLDVNKIHLILQNRTNKNQANEVVQDIIAFVEDNREFFDFKTLDEYSKQHRVEGAYDNKDIMFIKRMLQTALPFGARKVLIDRLFETYVFNPLKDSLVKPGRFESMLCYEMYMDFYMLRTLKNSGHHIGGHTKTHPHLASLSDEDQRREISSSSALCDAQMCQRLNTFCYPYGSHNQHTKDLLKMYNFKLAFGVEARVADLNKDDLYNLPRLDCNDFDKIVNKV